MERYWALTDAQIRNPFDFSQHFNVAPTTQIPIIYMRDGTLQLAMARWGLVPFWWKQPKMPPFTFNARIEEAASKPMWREPVKSARCLVPAIGWYEWKEAQVADPVTGEIKKAKQPFFLHLQGRQVLAFAGLMARRRVGESEDTILSAAIITKAAEGPANEVHSRMPLILPKEAEILWLDATIKDGQVALTQAEAMAVTSIYYHGVSSRVNNSKSSGADLVEPFQNPA